MACNAVGQACWHPKGHPEKLLTCQLCWQWQVVASGHLAVPEVQPHDAVRAAGNERAAWLVEQQAVHIDRRYGHLVLRADR
jgi:hypothetical protein